jgi:Flp pilus assembly pilin Flp
MLRRLWPVLLILGVLGWWRPALAQAMLQQVATDAAVTVVVPEGLRATPGLSALPDTPPRVLGIATFTDGSDKPLTVQIRKGEPHGWESLPAASAEVAAEWTRRFEAGLQLPGAYDFTPGRYEPERGALSLQYKVVGPSSARLMQRLPNSHPLWAATLAAGEDPAVAKCVIDALLVGQPSASEVELRARTGITAAVCSLPEALVSEFVRQLGTAEFAPAVTTVTYLSFFTRLGTIGTLILAPLERQQDVDQAAALIWRETEVAEAARLPVQFGSDLFRWAWLGGIVLGALLGVLVLGGAVSWLLTRLGLRAPLAVGSTLGLLCALSLLGWLRGGLQFEGGLQVGGYLLGCALAFRPLVRWLTSHGGSPLDRARARRRARGLSTVEYTVILVLLVCVAIGAWRVFGSSVQQALSKSDGQLEGLGQAALGEDSTGLEGSPDPTARGAQTPSAPLDRQSGDSRRGSDGTARRSEGAGPRRATEPGAGRAPAGGSGSARSGSGSSGTAASGSAAQGAATGALEGLLPGGVVTPPAPPVAPLPPSAGRVVASAAQEPSTLLTGTDIATDFVPYVSNVKDATVAITGVNPVTGEEVGTFGRVAAGVFAIPGAGNLIKYVGKGGKYVLKGGKAAYEAVQASRAAAKAAEVARTAAKAAEREAAQGLAKQAEERLAKEAAAAAAAAASRKLGTEANQAVFWSGIGANGEQVAKSWAEKNGGKTMEKIMEERGVKLPPWPTSGPVPEATEKAWRDASREFAQGASGNVRVLQGDSVGVGRVWGKDEFPALINNPNVKSITAVDPRTGQEILLWKR